MLWSVHHGQDSQIETLHAERAHHQLHNRYDCVAMLNMQHMKFWESDMPPVCIATGDARQKALSTDRLHP